MPRYKLSPIERAAERERKENLRKIMQGLDVKSFDDYKLEKKEQLSEELSEKTVLSSFEKYLKNSYGVE